MPSPSIWLQNQPEGSLGFSPLMNCPNVQVTWEDDDEEDKVEEDSPFLAALSFSPLAPFSIGHLQKSRWLSQMGICFTAVRRNVFCVDPNQFTFCILAAEL